MNGNKYLVSTTAYPFQLELVNNVEDSTTFAFTFIADTASHAYATIKIGDSALFPYSYLSPPEVRRQSGNIYFYSDSKVLQLMAFHATLRSNDY